jgi:hypothetical protein
VRQAFTDYQARWLSQVRDIAASPVPDTRAGQLIRKVLFPQHVHENDGTVEGCPGCFPPGEVTGKPPASITQAELATAITQFAPGQPLLPGEQAEGMFQLIETLRATGHDQAPELDQPFMPWPDLTREYDVPEILAAIRVVDAHLDANTAQAYRDQPLAGHMSRIGKAQSEAREAMEALAGVTGENPRKGICDTWEHVMEELGDTACAALLGIQHITKDTDITWAVFIAALAKGLARVPQARPAAPSTITGYDPDNEETDS